MLNNTASCCYNTNVYWLDSSCSVCVCVCVGVVPVCSQNQVHIPNCNSAFNKCSDSISLPFPPPSLHPSSSLPPSLLSSLPPSSSFPPSFFPPFTFPPSYPQQTDATATAIEHILGKTKEVLQPNPSKLESHSQNTVKIQVWPRNETVPLALQKKRQIHDVVFFLLSSHHFSHCLIASLCLAPHTCR